MTHMTHICDKVFVAMSIPLSQALNQDERFWHRGDSAVAGVGI